MWNLEDKAGCILGSDPWAFGREHGRVETEDQLEVFFSTSSTLRRYLKAALQHRYKVWHKHGRQQGSTASNSIKQLIPNTESTSLANLHFVPMFIPWHFQRVQKPSYTTSGLPLPWYISFTLGSPVRLTSPHTWVLNECWNSLCGACLALPWTDGSSGSCALTQCTLASRNCPQKEEQQHPPIASVMQTCRNSIFFIVVLIRKTQRKQDFFQGKRKDTGTTSVVPSLPSTTAGNFSSAEKDCGTMLLLQAQLSKHCKDQLH